MSKSELPPGWRSMKLGHILSDAQIIEVCRLLKSESDSNKRIDGLKKYLGTFREDLEVKGVDPHFLAYLLEFNLSPKLKS